MMISINGTPGVTGEGFLKGIFKGLTPCPMGQTAPLSVDDTGNIVIGACS